MLHYKEEWVWLNKFGILPSEESPQNMGLICNECGESLWDHYGDSANGHVVCPKDAEEYQKIPYDER